MATVVLGFAAAGVMLPFSSGASVQAEGVRLSLAAGLASDLVEEIAAEDFDQIIGLYDGYVEAAGDLKKSSGVVYSDSSYLGLSRESECSYVYVAQQSGLSSPDFILVTVSVYYKGRELIELNRLICR